MIVYLLAFVLGFFIPILFLVDISLLFIVPFVLALIVVKSLQMSLRKKLKIVN